MRRTVVITDKDLETLRTAWSRVEGNLDRSDEKAFKKLIEKVDRALNRVATPGADVAALDQALWTCRKYAPLVEGTTGSVFAGLSRQAGQKGLTPERVAAVGRWLDNQHWMTSSVSLSDLIRKWEAWWPKAERDGALSPHRYERPAGFED